MLVVTMILSIFPTSFPACVSGSLRLTLLWWIAKTIFRIYLSLTVRHHVDPSSLIAALIFFITVARSSCWALNHGGLLSPQTGAFQVPLNSGKPDLSFLVPVSSGRRNAESLSTVFIELVADVRSAANSCAHRVLFPSERPRSKATSIVQDQAGPSPAAGLPGCQARPKTCPVPIKFLCRDGGYHDWASGVNPPTSCAIE